MFSLTLSLNNLFINLSFRVSACIVVVSSYNVSLLVSLTTSSELPLPPVASTLSRIFINQQTLYYLMFLGCKFFRHSLPDSGKSCFSDPQRRQSDRLKGGTPAAGLSWWLRYINNIPHLLSSLQCSVPGFIVKSPKTAPKKGLISRWTLETPTIPVDCRLFSVMTEQN